MSNLNYQYIDPYFSPDKTTNYTLLVKADNNSLSFAVTDKNKLLLLAEGIDTGELNNPADVNNPLFNSYKQSIIGLGGDTFTFVPVSVFDPKKVADFARFLDVKAKDKVFSQPFDAENQVIFKVDETLLAAIAGRFDTKDVVFAPKGWVAAIAGSGPSNSNLFLNITGDTLEVLNFKNDKLRFYNTFEFQNEDELVYFASFVSGELQLPHEATTLILSGDIELNDKNSKRLSEFFNKVELNKAGIVDMPAQFPSHASLALTALSLCGSSEAN